MIAALGVVSVILAVLSTFGLLGPLLEALTRLLESVAQAAKDLSSSFSGHGKRGRD